MRDYEIHMTHDDKGLKTDILEINIEDDEIALECLECITTFEQLHTFMMEHKDDKFIITAS